MLLALATGLCIASGYLIVQIAWPTTGADRLLKWSLSLGFGLGFSSATFFVSCALNLRHFLAIDAFCLTLLLSAYFLRRRKSKAIDVSPRFIHDLDLPSRLYSFLIAACGIALVTALYSSIKLAMARPHGDGWDAFAIWNLHARFLFRGAHDWRDGVSSLIPWSHPDYPLLLPASIAYFWTYLGTDNPVVPAVIGPVFTFSTMGLLYAGLARVRGRSTAMLGLVTLGSTPFFIEQGTSQYADVPLAFFLLASIALLSIYGQYRAYSVHPRGLVALAGLALGFAAWTKNEGVLFVFATVVALLSLLVLRKRREASPDESPALLFNLQALAVLMAASAPVLALVLWFKHVAPQGDLMQDADVMLQKILTPTRYWVILKWYAKDFFRFGEWPLPATLLLPALYFTTGERKPGPRPASLRISIWTVTLTLAGYFAIYVITPNELDWHLRFSLNRLFLQLWPSVVFLFFSSVSFRSFNSVSK